MAEGGAKVDVITQLQEQTNALCSKLFNFLGALQRDAPPVSLKGEPVLASGAGGADAEAQTELMANELVESFTALEALIQHLPPTDQTEAEQVAEIAALQAANAEASAALRQELAAAEGQLAQLQRAFSVLADLRLAGWQQGTGAGVAGPRTPAAGAASATVMDAAAAAAQAGVATGGAGSAGTAT